MPLCFRRWKSKTKTATAMKISMMFASQLLPQIRAGRLRAIAITSAKRSQVAPEIPTVAESGVPGYEAGTWFGLIAPTATPRDVVAKLNAAVTRAAQLQEIRDQLMTQSSAEPMSGTPEQAGVYIRGEAVKWRKVVAAAGLKVE